MADDIPPHVRAAMQADADELRDILKDCEANGPTFSAAQMAMTLHALRKDEREIRAIIAAAVPVLRFLNWHIDVSSGKAAKEPLGAVQYDRTFGDVVASVRELEVLLRLPSSSTRTDR